MPEYDLIVVPGGGVRGAGELPPWVRNRFDAALERAGPARILALSAGTPYRRDAQVFESDAGARYLIARGFPPARVLVERSSYDTIGNAFFSRVVHVEPANFRRLLVITSHFHAARTEAVFRWVYALEPARERHLDFFAVPDTGLSEDALEARHRKETAALEQLAGLMAGISSLRDLHHWLFTRHSAYAPGAERSAAADADLLESY